MKLKDLPPNPLNPRKISDEKRQALHASLQKFGDLSGIVFNRKSGQLEGGHQRGRILPADSEIIITKTYDVPTLTGTVALGYVNIDEELFSYREVEWDQVTANAANIAANQHGGEWDFPQLADNLIDLDTNNFDIGLTGFDETELVDVLAPVGFKKIKQCPKCGEDI